MSDLGEPPVEDEPRGPARRPPWSRDAEESLLGAMIQPYADGRARALRETDVGDLWLADHRIIFSAIEWLHAHGEAVDAVTVHDRIVASGEPGADDRPALSRQHLLELLAEVPASANVKSYATIIRRYARARAAITYGEELVDAGYAGEETGLDALAAMATHRLAPQALDIETDDLIELWELADAEREEPTKPFVIPGCLRQGEAYVLTGSEGGGKAVYLRQVGACIASGMHPFTGLREEMGPGGERGVQMAPRNVLYLDLQEDRVDQAAELVKLRRGLGAHYQPGHFHAVSWPDGVDLLSPHGRRKIEGALNVARPELVLVGPLVKTFRAPEGRSRYGEDVIDELTEVWDDLMLRYGFAVMIEAHAGNDRGSDSDWRVRGSSVWRSWPAFSHGLKLVSTGEPREAEVIRARPDRYDGRAFPTRLFENKAWRLPWQVSDADYARVVRAMGLHWLLGEAEQTELAGLDPYHPEPTF